MGTLAEGPRRIVGPDLRRRPAGRIHDGEVKPFLLLIGALFVGVLLWRLVQKNAPLTYDPTKPPRELIE
jgi:hypothetical protein